MAPLEEIRRKATPVSDSDEDMEDATGTDQSDTGSEGDDESDKPVPPATGRTPRRKLRFTGKRSRPAGRSIAPGLGRTPGISDAFNGSIESYVDKVECAKIAYRETLKARYAVPAHTVRRKLYSTDDIGIIAEFLFYLHSHVVGPLLFWTPHLEAWLETNFVASGEVMAAWRDFCQDNPPKIRGTSDILGEVAYGCHCNGYDDFKDRFIGKLFQYKSLSQVVRQYIMQLQVDRTSPGAPHTYADLCRRSKAALRLLPSGSTIGLETQLSMTLDRFPEALRASIMSDAQISERPLNTWERLINVADAKDTLHKSRSKRGRDNNDNHDRAWKFHGNKNNGNNNNNRNNNGNNNNGNANAQTGGQPGGKPTGRPNANGASSSGISTKGYDKYRGTCDGCGKTGHSIMTCWNTSDANKKEWQAKVAASKKAKRATGSAQHALNNMNLSDQPADH